MKLLLVIAAGASCALCACVVADRNVRSEDASFAFSTFNVRGIVPEDVGSVFWTNRVPLIARTIVSHGMDVVCVQECRRRMALALADASVVSVSAHEGPQHTFRGWGRDVPCKTIDYVFVTPDVKVLRHATLTDRYDGIFPSDHCPLLTTVALRSFDQQ